MMLIITNNLDIDNDNFFGNDSFGDASNLNDLLNYNDSDLENCTVDKVTTFFAKLLSNYGLPRNHVQNLYQEIQELFFNDCLGKIEEYLSFIPISDNNKNAIDRILSICKNFKYSFKLMSTEYRRIQYFQTNRQYVKPQTYIISHGTEQYVSETGQFIPLRQMLELFFQIPRALEDILLYMNSLPNSSDRIFNYIQTDMWKHKLSLYKPDDIVLSLIFYFDDFESNNPLDPKSGKLGVVYVTLLCLPPECQFTSENIFLTLIFESISRKLHGNKKTFAPPPNR